MITYSDERLRGRLNVTLALLTVGSPISQACIVAVQLIVAIPLLAWHRDHPADQSVQAGSHQIAGT